MVTFNVVWSWSIADPENIVFIYREDGKEFEIDLRFYLAGEEYYNKIRLFVKERDMLNKIKKENGK